MAGEDSRGSLEQRVAEQLARYGSWASIISLGILILVCASNLLVAIKVIAALTLAPIITLGPILSAITSGFSTFTTFVRRARVMARREKLNLSDEATDVAMDQAGAALPVLTRGLEARLGCSATLAPLVLVASLIMCLLTFGPAPFKVFGGNVAINSSDLRVTATATSTLGHATIPTATTTATSQPTSTPIPTIAPTSTTGPTATSAPIPTVTPTVPPGHLLVTTPTVAAGTCGLVLTQQNPGKFSFTDNGGTTVYWQINQLSSYYQLATGYPLSSQLQPNESDTQDELFVSNNIQPATITIGWGTTPGVYTSSASVQVTCRPIS